jgi:hypothetical protein
MVMVKRLLIAVALGAGLASDAHATPSYFASAGVLSGLDQESFTDVIPVSANAGGIITFSIGGGGHLGLGTWAGESAAQAGPGYLQTSSHTSVVITDHQASLGSGAKAGGSHATFTIDDVMISGPGSGTVSGTLNLLFEGSLDASANFANAIGGSGSYGQVSIGVGLPGFSGNGGARLGASAPPANTLTLTNSGLLAGYGGGLLALQINSASLPINTLFSITLDLQSETLASYTVDGTGPAVVPISAEGFSNYSNALSFARSGPVFTLPENYTADSPSGKIVDNHFVPEPANIVLLGPGLCVWLWMAVRRRRRLALSGSSGARR